MIGAWVRAGVAGSEVVGDEPVGSDVAGSDLVGVEVAGHSVGSAAGLKVELSVGWTVEWVVGVM